MWRDLHAPTGRVGKAGRKDAFGRLVEAGPPPGLLAYDDAQAVGWVAVGRVEASAASMWRRSPSRSNLAENEGVYAITCFFVRPGHRKRGLTRELACAAVDFAKANGASAVEACAIEADRPLIWATDSSASPRCSARWALPRSLAARRAGR